MAIYLKKFENHTQYDTYINGSEAILPNVSICTTEGDVHYNPYVEPETRVVATFNVTDTSNPTKIASATTAFTSIEIDGVTQESVTTGYTFSTTGEHTVKYTLKDPTRIGDYAFSKCSRITSIDIPNSVTSIGASAFTQCSRITSIDIPNNVTRIGSGAFMICDSLTSIDIPNSVTNIGSGAFLYCDSLTSATVRATTPPTLGINAFNNNASGRKIYVPSASVETYKSATNWSTYANDIEAIA